MLKKKLVEKDTCLYGVLLIESPSCELMDLNDREDWKKTHGKEKVDRKRHMLNIQT